VTDPSSDSQSNGRNENTKQYHYHKLTPTLYIIVLTQKHLLCFILISVWNKVVLVSVTYCFSANCHCSLPTKFKYKLQVNTALSRFQKLDLTNFSIARLCMVETEASVIFPSMDRYGKRTCSKWPMDPFPKWTRPIPISKKNTTKSSKQFPEIANLMYFETVSTCCPFYFSIIDWFKHLTLNLHIKYVYVMAKYKPVWIFWRFRQYSPWVENKIKA